MRTNNRKYDYKQRITIETPIYNRLIKSFETNKATPVKGELVKVIDATRISGTNTVEFYLKKEY